jgi:tetratricopeptide (TPR) repeat protein
MSILLPLLTPSELLCYSDPPSFVTELLQRSRARRHEGCLPDAERSAIEALEASLEAGDYISQGAALLCLADVNREMGKLGPALSNCQKAHRIFQRQPSRYQRHNEATAAYALGLVHHLLGNDVDALKWYQIASKQFEKARKEWAAVNALARVGACSHVESWLETLTGYLINVQANLSVNPATRIQVPIVLLDGDTERFAIAEVEIDQYRMDRRLTIDGVEFRLQSVKGNRRIGLEPGAECYALEIPEEARESLEAGEGDYALIVRGNDADKEGPGVLEALSGPEFGNFERDAEGHVNFVSFKAAVMIGSDRIADDFEVGYITAILKREPN